MRHSTESLYSDELTQGGYLLANRMVEAANHSCGNFDAEDDEFILAGNVRRL